MLRIHTSRSSYAVKNYFETADYYSRGTETVGRWFGDLAAEWGLVGAVTRADFDRLCDNVHPATGARLTQRTREYRRIGDDFVFSLMKDVGAFIMLRPPAEREALLATVEERAYQVMGVIEDDVQTRVRQGGAFENRPGAGIAGAGYRHTTARPVGGRPPDPHPHWHLFTFNATRDPVEGGRIKAADLANVYRDRPFYEALFFALVAQDFRRIGLPIERRGNGKWGLAGLESLIATFSKRTDAIEDEARRLNITDPGAKDELGGKTRARKDHELTQEQLDAAWHAQLSDDQRDAIDRVWRGAVAQAPEVSAEEAAAFAVAHCFEQYSVVPERELFRVALQHGLGSVTVEEIAAELPRHGVFVGELDGRRMATTEALQAEEDDLARFAADGRWAEAPVGVAPGLDPALKDGKRLSDEQWRAVTGLLESTDRVRLLEGPAGSGKSSLLAKLDEGLRRTGRAPTWLGTTARAAEVLEGDGLEAHTVQRFLVDAKLQQAAIAGGGEVVCDEASMLGHRDAHRLFDLADRLGLRLTFVGDDRQHGAVPRGSFLHVLKAYGGLEPFQVTKIIRQESPEYRAAAQAFADGRTAEGFDRLDALGDVHELDLGDIARHVAADYLQATRDGAACVVVSPTHAEARQVTAAIRADLRAEGRIGGEADEREFTRLAPVNTSEAERKQSYTFRPGDVLVWHQNAEGFTKGDRTVVTDPAAVPSRFADRFALHRPEAIRLAPGDRIAFTGRVEALGGDKAYRNGQSAVVTGFTRAGNIRLGDGHVIAADAAMIRHGYVATTFAAQGTTARRAILAMSSRSLAAVNMEALYVAATRARQWVHLYTDDKEAVRREAQETSRKHAALDLGRPDELSDWAEPQRWWAEQRRRGEDLYAEATDRGEDLYVAAPEGPAAAWAAAPPAPEPWRPPAAWERERPHERGLGHGR